MRLYIENLNSFSMSIYVLVIFFLLFISDFQIADASKLELLTNRKNGIIVKCKLNLYKY